MPTNDEYVKANRTAWNEAASIHRRYTFDHIVDKLTAEDFSFFDKVATEVLGKLEVADKSVAQLGCNNGRELLSIKRLGAADCVGFDISDDFIEQAQEIASLTHINCDFVRSDINDISSDYDAQYDLVIVTKGVLGWQPNLSDFFQVACRLLRSSGWLFMYEMHPVLDMFWDSELSDNPEPHHSYFRREPFLDYSGLDFFSKTTEFTSAPAYWFHHKMSDILTSLVVSGFSLVSFDEYEHDVSGWFANLTRIDTKFPLCYTLMARK